MDGQETPYPLIYTARFYEVQRHLAKTGHVYTPFVLLASKKWFGGLSEEDKAAVREAAKESAAFQRDLSRKDAERLEGELAAKGFQITQPTPEALDAMRERVAPVVKEFSEKIGSELVEKARADMAAAAGQ